ncbi:hypothetical protein FRC03_004348 [Tulasnella sp. 419]|nr:hypothetical protein FRC03_004348 [Tulasnella sp. 419]
MINIQVVGSVDHKTGNVDAECKVLLPGVEPVAVGLGGNLNNGIHGDFNVPQVQGSVSLYNKDGCMWGSYHVKVEPDQELHDESQLIPIPSS